MRRVKRLTIDQVAQAYLSQQQTTANNKLINGSLNVVQVWKAARQTKKMGMVLDTLQSMMGVRQRCMYCLDSHGCDIEHFRPKASYPKWMFKWNNLLLCCTACGRIKGSKFPMDGRHPMLIDPAREEPWDYLDFDPITGNMTARFDLQANDFSAKGQYTVTTLELDQREPLAAGYVTTYQNLRAVITNYLKAPNQGTQHLIDELIDEDERGLLGWCFKGNGQNETLLKQLRMQHPLVWQSCLVAFKFR